MPRGKKRQAAILTDAEKTLICYESLLEMHVYGDDDGRSTLASAARLVRAKILTAMNGNGIHD